MLRQNVDIVLEWLKDPVCNSIGVCGMGGVGKTMLLKYIFNILVSDPSIAGSVYWVDVNHCSLLDIQKKILEAIGEDLSGKESSYTTAAHLYHALVKKRNVILILNDVWDWFALDDIGIPLEKNGCKILLSTRRREVCRIMGSEGYVVQIEKLTETEARDLFVHRLENYNALTPEVQQIANLVVKECDCLPLAITSTAQAMRGVFDFDMWQNVLDELRSLSGRQDDVKKRALQTLRISYECLRDVVLKHCFLSCALYPQGHDIGREELIDLWIMGGFLDGVKGRHDGYNILSKLENLCLLESWTSCSQKKYVKMHDLMREMALIIMKENPCFLAESGLQLNEIPQNEHWNKDLVKASLSHNSIREIPYDISPETPNLTVLLLNNNPLQEIPEPFFVHMKALEILDLSRTNIEKLPNSISDMENLRMFLLVGCEWLEYVPSVVKLTKLKVLGLPFMSNLKDVPKGMDRLKSLETLTYCRWKISDVTLFNSFIESAPSLSHYVLELYDEGNDVDEFFEADFESYDKCISISGGEFGDNASIPNIPSSAERAHFQGMKIKMRNNLTDLLPSFAGLTKLKFLGVWDCEGLEYIAKSASQIQSQDSCVCLQFESLEQLVLGSLCELRRILKCGAYSFSHLKEMIISMCPKVEMGLPLNSALLPELKCITVIDCQELEEIFEYNHTSSSSSEIHSANFNPILALPKLEHLFLEGLPKLRSVYRGVLLCSSLEGGGVHINECQELNLLPLLSESLICDRSSATRASIPNKDDTPKWWEPLLSNYPEDAHKLSRFKALG